MLAARLGSILLLSLGLFIGSTAGAGTVMYPGRWTSESFGNDVTGGPTESQYWSILGNPLGTICNGKFPICKFASTPINAKGEFFAKGPYCTPYAKFGSVRPTAPGKTITESGTGYVSTVGVRYRTPPLYRNKHFFTPSGSPDLGACGATTTAMGAPATAYVPPFYLQRGVAQIGKPLTGMITANVVTASSAPAFTFPAAGTASGGIRRTTLGSFSQTVPYLYSYTYRTLRNDAGNFFKNGGPGSFSTTFYGGKASIKIQAGANQFGGTMRLLGNESGKVCFLLNNGCSLGGADWKYRYAGTAATTTLTGSVRKVLSFTTMYYNTAGMGSSTVMVIGSRFPWTTGTVTVTAVGRGPHRTIEQRKGFDSRTSMGAGTIQLVTPLLTRWLQTGANFETGGIAIFRLPEPQKWMMLVAGLSLLGVLYRARPR